MPLRAGRPLNPHLRAEWKLSVRATIAARVDLLLEDPVTRKPKYGARSKLIEGLLEQWLADQGEVVERNTPVLSAAELVKDV